MKQTIIILFAAMVFISAASCTKEEHPNINDQSGVRVVELTFDNADVTKVGVSDRTPQWEVGDKVWLSNGTNSEEVTLKAADITTGNVAKITTSLQGTLYGVYPAGAQNGVSGGKIGFKIPTSTDGSFGNAHISVAEGTTTLSFKNVVSIFTITTENATAMVNISSNSYIAGEFKVTYSTLGIEAGSKQAKSVNITSSSAGDKYVAVASGVTFSAFEFTAIKTATNWAYKKSTSSTETAANSIYPIGNVSDWAYSNIGSLWAKFSTSASTKVRFSKGNLYCDKNTKPFKYWFEANQFDFRHYNSVPDDAAVIEGNSTTTPSGTVGSFYWSETETEAYSKKDPDPKDENKHTSDIFFTNKTKTTPQPYFIAAGQTGVWRTLSGGNSGEWEFLLDNRAGVSVGSTTNARYAEVKVNSIAGLLIFPDVFIWPDDNIIKPSTFNTNSSNWNNVNYSKTDFAKLETAGCVFLPAAGYRGHTTTVHDIGISGSYWSSTAHDTNQYRAYALNFAKDKVNPGTSENTRAYPEAVRLVTAAK